MQGMPYQGAHIVMKHGNLKEALVNTIHNVSDRARNLFRLNMLHDICAVTNVGAQVH